MIIKPQKKWLPRTLEALAPWYGNFALKFDLFAVDLGFAAADIASVNNDNLVVQWLLDAQTAFDANIDGFRDFRDETLYGEENDPKPNEPVTTLPSPPAVMTAAIIERLVNLVGRIKLAKNYTEDIGSQLGIIGSESESIAPENWKPTLKVRVLAGGDASVEFVRGESNGILLEQQKGNETVWTKIGNFNSSPAGLHYEETAPQTIRLRGRLLQKNDPVGEYSDIVQFVTNP